MLLGVLYSVWSPETGFLAPAAHVALAALAGNGAIHFFHHGASASPPLAPSAPSSNSASYIPAFAVAFP